ncbi:MAG: NAD(P)-dependent oxidoreductase [Clostridiales bacterium]|jgi:UDP-glucose 4-epimerase|nr:NAD(P)-dependent oxidoreductase [Clostridiales bacterium]
MKIFVTGGTGFIGSYIVEKLLEDGNEITIYARNPNKVSGFLNREKIAFVQGAMAESEKFSEGLKGHDALIHVALAWGDTPTEMLFNETLPSVRLFEASARAGVSRIIYTSSIAAFGSAATIDSGCVKPADSYGATKASAEAYLMAIGAKHGIKVNAVRPGYTFGNPAVEGGFIYSDKKIKNMVASVVRGEDLEFAENDGTQFIWAGDLAKIFAAVIASDVDRNYYTGVSKDFRQWGDIAKRAAELAGSKSEIRFIDKGIPKAKTLPIDVSQIERDFGFEFHTDEKMDEHLEHLIKLKMNEFQ